MARPRPTPPSSFRTKDQQSLEDLHRIRRYLADLMGWVDDVVAEAGGGGSLTEVAAGGGISVTAGTGPVATVTAAVQALTAGTGISITGGPNYTINAVGGGAPSAHATTHQNGGTDELNLAGLNGQLADPQPSTPALAGCISAANSGISGLTSKAIPVLADTLPINDSAASNALKQSTVQQLGDTILYNYGMYLQPPNSPNAFDDEFRTGSSDLVTRGWLVRNLTTGTNLTRLGDIIPYSFKWSTPVIGRNEYRSTLFQGRMQVQFHQQNADTYVIYKAVTLPTTAANYGGLLWGVYDMPVSQTSTIAVGNNLGVAFWPATGGFPNQNIFARCNRPGSGNAQLLTQNGGTNNVQISNRGPLAGVLLATTATNPQVMGFCADPINGGDSCSTFLTNVNMPTVTSVAFAGFAFTPDPTTSQGSSDIVYLDFMRLRTGDMQANATTRQWIWP